MAYRRITRAALLEAAAQIFASKGYHGATTAEIAQRAAMPPGSIYYHIESKEQLPSDVLANGMSHALEIIRKAQRSRKRAPERLFEAIYLTIKATCDQENCAGLAALSLAFAQPFTIEGTRLNKRYPMMRNRYERAFREMIQDGIDEGFFRPTDVTLEARLIMSVIFWVQFWYRPGGSLSSHEVAVWHARRLVEGLLESPGQALLSEVAAPVLSPLTSAMS